MLDARAETARFLLPGKSTVHFLSEISSAVTTPRSPGRTHEQLV
jgi:hypothetical protein